MKKSVIRALAIALTVFMLVCAVSCAKRDQGAGIGTIDMETDKEPKKIGALGEPSSTPEQAPVPDSSTPAPQQTPQPPQQTPQQSNEYMVFSCPQQNFSFLYDPSYSTVWEDENGAKVYTENDGVIPYIMVYRNIFDDTTGFDVQEHFYYEIEDMKTQYGSRLLSVGDIQKYNVSGKEMTGVMYTYVTEDKYTIELFRLLEDTGESLIQYTCKYHQGQSESAMGALALAAATYQPDANYYTSQSGSTSPSSPSTPTPPSAPTQFETEQYECDYFTVPIPKGWSVDYDIVDAGGNMKRIYLFVTDPTNPRNIFFFVQAMEPFYVSESAKSAYLPFLPAYYSAAPVLSGDPSAQALLSVWPAAYALMSAEPGAELSKHFSDYRLSKVLEAQVLESSTADCTNSYVTATVDIPNVTGQYRMLLMNSLQLMNAPTGLPSSAKYYISYSNQGIVLSESQVNSLFSSILGCLEKLDLSGFAQKTSNQQGLK